MDRDNFRDFIEQLNRTAWAELRDPEKGLPPEVRGVVAWLRANYGELSARIYASRHRLA